MKNEELAKLILENVGGAKNIKNLTHCVTRLRFTLYDDKKANKKTIENLDGVLGVQEQGGQFQVIVGSKVNKVYQELIGNPQLALSEDGPKETGKKKSVISNILETISSILIPSLPPVIGGGMIKGFLFMFWEFGWIEWGSDIFNLLNIISDGMFYFYPFLLAVSAAKRFKTNPYMALAIAGSMMHPTIYEGINAGLKSLKVIGSIGVPYLDYNSSVIPIILSVWVMSYVYRFFEKKIPDIVSVIFTPMLTLVIVIPVCMIMICPLGYYIGEYIAQGVQVLIDFSPIVASIYSINWNTSCSSCNCISAVSNLWIYYNRRYELYEYHGTGRCTTCYLFCIKKTQRKNEEFITICSCFRIPWSYRTRIIWNHREI